MFGKQFAAKGPSRIKDCKYNELSNDLVVTDCDRIVKVGGYTTNYLNEFGEVRAFKLTELSYVEQLTSSTYKHHYIYLNCIVNK